MNKKKGSSVIKRKMSKKKKETTAMYDELYKHLEYKRNITTWRENEKEYRNLYNKKRRENDKGWHENEKKRTNLRHKKRRENDKEWYENEKKRTNLRDKNRRENDKEKKKETTAMYDELYKHLEYKRGRFLLKDKENLRLRNLLLYKRTSSMYHNLFTHLRCNAEPIVTAAQCNVDYFLSVFASFSWALATGWLCTDGHMDFSNMRYVHGQKGEEIESVKTVIEHVRMENDRHHPSRTGGTKTITLHLLIDGHYHFPQSTKTDDEVGIARLLQCARECRKLQHCVMRDCEGEICDNDLRIAVMHYVKDEELKRFLINFVNNLDGKKVNKICTSATASAYNSDWMLAMIFLELGSSHSDGNVNTEIWEKILSNSADAEKWELGFWCTHFMGDGSNGCSDVMLQKGCVKMHWIINKGLLDYLLIE